MKTAAIALTAVLAAATLTASAAPIKINWEDGKLDAWSAVDEKDLGDKGPSNWVIAAGPIDGKALNQTSNIWGDATDTVAIGTFFIYNAAEFVSFTLDADVVAQDNDGVGIVWAYKSPEEHYRMFMMLDASNPPNGEKGPWRKLEKRLGPGTGSKLPFYDKPMDINKGEAYSQGAKMHWRLEVNAGEFKFALDGKDVLKGKDTTYSKGKIGFQLYAESNIFIDNIAIEDLGLAVSPAGRLASAWADLKR
ncbi:hypothetical protein FJZ36_00700 [Candidatus Poribacteria bacterium]|nr:hypothetical protein [Candidatus Poribacteria bacterium]